ncbi:hypothetical protein [Dyella flagellata]|uniref:DUF2884 family protein n=1 Tax=Dyella flagellata TaxID=1867833 RepID=A0ABQ5X5Z2_9GAMM|nr:hypothetical protein [Dyella flagellata]GLQ87055.1 hypothetical protein GCM10007898_06210 [Dyella flagellata]
MKHQGTILLLALCTALAACDAPDFNYRGENGRISLDGNVLTLHVDDVPDATVGSSGDFIVDGKVESISSAQHGLLVLYYQGVADIRDQANGLKAGVTAAKNAFVEKPGPDAKQKLKEAVESQAHQMSVKMCQDEVNLAGVQAQLVAQLPAFKPYGNIFPAKHADECTKA